LQEVTTSGAPDPEAYKAFIRGEMGPFVARFLPDHEAWRAFGPRGRRLGALVKAVLQWLRQPVLLNDLVSFLELLLPLKPSPPVAVTKGPGGAIEMSDWALEIGRLLLRMKLSRAERGAFLLTRNVQTIKQIGLNFYLVAMMVGYCEGLRQAPGFLAAAWDSLCLAEKQEIAGALRPAIGLPSEARLEDLPVLLLARWDSLTPQQRERARGILARTIQSPRRDLPSGVIPPFLASFPDDPGPVGQGLVQRVMQAFQASQAGPAPGDDSEQPASTPRTLAAFPAIWSRLAQDGLTFQEIGDILGIQATTVASRQSECKKKLRKALEKKWD